MLIAKALGSERVLNLVTREDLLGEDTLSAAAGYYYSDNLPIKDYFPYVGSIQGKKIKGLNQTTLSKAYDKDGNPVYNKNNIYNLMNVCYRDDATPIIQLQCSDGTCNEIYKSISEKELEFITD